MSNKKTDPSLNRLGKITTNYHKRKKIVGSIKFDRRQHPNRLQIYNSYFTYANKKASHFIRTSPLTLCKAFTFEFKISLVDSEHANRLQIYKQSFRNENKSDYIFKSRYNNIRYICSIRFYSCYNCRN